MPQSLREAIRLAENRSAEAAPCQLRPQATRLALIKAIWKAAS